ncbi:uncharacterized protein SPSK_08421 [Sporothrix schenckii 1099-18]|uniref:ATP-dependent DNA ligase family profile domain-containing protein n=1 Tax=Sporothrix schenckii 1099-18 TaxID=1397361 RepID=A0A0F2MA58_SPOSC|nr:uncharacterized protein SPSK_08421 [Sporothrix schenckii 1099-18]KJR85046.1 hypothetical protein SPSK_08421 [Sporothrix schenckii 1099-18]
MPFLFSHVCDLFQQVAELPTAHRSRPRSVNLVVQSWFAEHRKEVDALIVERPTSSAAGSSGAAALLSTLLPDRRTDRVYALQARGLQRILIRALGLGHSRVPELSRWMRPCDHATTGPVDLADCVEAILQRTPNPTPNVPVTVEEIDATLHGVAARCRFSAPAVRGRHTARPSKNDFIAPPPTQDALARLYQRLDPCGAKWLTRLILRDLRPAVLDGAVVARAFHRALPQALQVFADLEAAVASLSGDNDIVRPRLGVKVGRQQWAKGRSIQHCIAMGGPQRMSCEHKMDGEYVQVHVNLVNGPDHKDCLQLFSKSGKDSTWDRVNLHSAIRESLRLGQPDCPITKGCILEGEMLAYDEKAAKIMDFDAIRKHVNRSGSRLYCDPRGDTQDHEHLMIVYYDVMLVDDESLLSTSREDRFRRLEKLVTCRPGYAELVKREIVDFRARTAPAQLRRAFARCITAHLEGLVLKPLKDPYFDLKGPGSGTTSSTTLEWPHLTSYVIKLKKGYIGGFGEVGDFAIVGARYDACKAREYPSDLPGLKWTHFFIGCQETPKAGQTRPRFVVTNVVTLTPAQMATFLRHCRPRVVPMPRRTDGRKTRNTRRATSTPGADGGHRDTCPFDLAPLEPGLDDSKGGPTDLFADPPVVDIRCFSFHRPGYGRFWSPRFPSVVKFHFDRTWADTLPFDDLQTMAVEAEARTAVYDDDFFDGPDSGGGSGGPGPDAYDASQHAHWVAQLKRADKGGIAMDAETSQSQSQSQSPSQSTTRSQSSSGSTQRTQSATSQPPLSAGLGLPLIDILEEAEAEDEDKGLCKQSQLSIVTVKTYDERYDKYEKAKLAKAKLAKPNLVVSVIDLTGDTQETEVAEETERVVASVEESTVKGSTVEEDAAVGKREILPGEPSPPRTPKRRATSLPLMGTSPMTPKTPPRVSNSPLPPASCSPIDFVSSLTAPSTADGSQASGSDESQSSLDGLGSQDSLEKNAHRTKSLPGDTPSRKRLRAWDAASLDLCPVSPPQLKRARSGL